MENFLEIVASATAARLSRDAVAEKILNDRTLFPALLALASDVENPGHVKACQVLELVLAKEFSLLLPHLHTFVYCLPRWSQDTAVRSAAKIVWWSLRRRTSDCNFLSDTFVDTMVETAFSWLTSEHKVAAKVHAVRALYEAGKYRRWIYPQLVPLIQQGFAGSSPAYRAVVREVIAKLRKAGVELP